MSAALPTPKRSVFTSEADRLGPEISSTVRGNDEVEVVPLEMIYVRRGGDPFAHIAKK
jgi:hypothetical protein